ncbi:hypothetical protein NP493_59g03010 [Ridgeia piscesae]|uniref:Uncharacterized protein n=1 Tax=Ridgeia piscesae TaxID=27915 RepID=A0AAD9UJ09_RIDPI|nr:hypothetical protein NP493_59g03010 [Ridgeia piscesae]
MGSLHNALNLFAEKVEVEDDLPDCANVNVDVVFPNVLPPSELFGHFDAGVWRQGILSKIFSEAHDMVVAVEGMIKEAGSKAGSRQPIETPSIICKWLVLDGDLHPDWVDNMASLLDCGQSLSLASGQQIQLHDSTSVIFELLDLTNASPSTITQCALVHCHPGSLSWKSLVESWMHMAKQRWVMTTAR